MINSALKSYHKYSCHSPIKTNLNTKHGNDYTDERGGSNGKNYQVFNNITYSPEHNVERTRNPEIGSKKNSLRSINSGQ